MYSKCTAFYRALYSCLYSCHWSIVIQVYWRGSLEHLWGNSGPFEAGWDHRLSQGEVEYCGAQKKRTISAEIVRFPKLFSLEYSR